MTPRAQAILITDHVYDDKTTGKRLSLGSSIGSSLFSRSDFKIGYRSSLRRKVSRVRSDNFLI